MDSYPRPQLTPTLSTEHHAFTGYIPSKLAIIPNRASSPSLKSSVLPLTRDISLSSEAKPFHFFQEYNTRQPHILSADAIPFLTSVNAVECSATISNITRESYTSSCIIPLKNTLSSPTTSGHILSFSAAPFVPSHDAGLSSSPVLIKYSSSSNTTSPRQQHSTYKFGTIFLCTDGGSRTDESVSATGWVLYNSRWSLAAGRGKPFPNGTNNDAELSAALDGLLYATSTVSNSRIILITDSTLVEGGLTGHFRLNSTFHRSIRNRILSLQGFRGNFIFTYQAPREYNSGADRMCNLAMDFKSVVHQFDMSATDALNDRQLTRSYVLHHILPYVPSYGEAAIMAHRYKFRLLMMELLLMTSTHDVTSYTTPGGPLDTKTSQGSFHITGFETDVSSHVLDGIERVIPPSAIEKIRLECLKHKIPWKTDAFSRNAYNDTCPKDDISMLSSLCRAVGNDVGQVIRWFRNQTNVDSRPNKHLRPLLYRKHLKDYPGLEDLCLLAQNGFHSRIKDFSPPRPFHENHQSALDRGPAVQRKLIKEARLGKTLLLEESTALMDYRVNTCPYAVAEKKRIDYKYDGRLIHNASFPKGSSVNDAVPHEKLDASTDDVHDLARRVLDLYLQFPSVGIFGMVADVDNAFQNAHADETSCLIFGGKVPDTSYVAIALTAIFGYRDSPAIFALLARAAQHYHHLGTSDLLGTPTPFHSWMWVDDFIGIEPDLADRLVQSELRLRSSFHLVFGSPGWNIEKFAPWSNLLHAVGLDWNLMNGTVSMPDEKISKALRKVQECLTLVLNGMKPSLQSWRSLVGTIRHVGSCIPAAKPFYHTFVNIEKTLVVGGLPDWSNLECDLRWFQTILNRENLNGITLERFVSHSDRTETLFLSWTDSHTFIIDFHRNQALIIKDEKASLGGLLFEYYVCTEILTPFAMGPFPRNDLKIDLMCKTADSAHRISMWEYKDYSLRQLGWMCTQQHISIFCSGPKIGNIDLSNYTNSFLQVLQEMPALDVVIPSALPFVNGLTHSNVLASAPAQDARMEAKSSRGLNSAPYSASRKAPSTSNRSTIKMKFSECMLQRAVWDMDRVSPSAQRPSATSGCPPSKLTIKKNTTTKSQRACVWRWVWKAIENRTPPPHHHDSHLVPISCAFLEPSSWQKAAPNPSFSGVVPSWGFCPSAVQEKCGALSRKTVMKIISSSGRTLPMDMAPIDNVKPTGKRNGSKSTSSPPRATGTRKVVEFAWEKSRIRWYVQSEPYGGFKKAESTSSCGILPIAEFLKSAPEWSSIDSKSSIESRKLRRRMDWTQSSSRATRYESEGLRNLWQQGLTRRSSNSWVDGSQTATWPTSASIPI